MNGYLVMLRHSHDDIPLLLADSHSEAVAFAKKVTEEDGGRECKLLGIDSSTPCNVSIYWIANGVLLRSELIKDFTEQD